MSMRLPEYDPEPSPPESEYDPDRDDRQDFEACFWCGRLTRIPRRGLATCEMCEILAETTGEMQRMDY